MSTVITTPVFLELSLINVLNSKTLKSFNPPQKQINSICIDWQILNSEIDAGLFRVRIERIPNERITNTTNLKQEDKLLIWTVHACKL